MKIILLLLSIFTVATASAESLLLPFENSEPARGVVVPYGRAADALKAKAGITLDKRKIVLGETIKNVGTYTATCKLGYEITAPLTVKIEEL